ncbi:MAG: biotin synthase BioB [Deltaproteobacteria bacterium]|nr:biotin synthase BioB [Deltaproteobacteria bacterium]
MTQPITPEEAVALLNADGTSMYQLFHHANETRLKHRGNTVNLCGIVNAKSGMCTEDCKFCAQSAHNDVKNVSCYQLMNAETIVEKAKVSEQNHAVRFGIVTSGLAVDTEEEIQSLEKSVSSIQNQLAVKPCASLGNVSRDTLIRLKAAGLTRYHCNLETARSYYPEICTTRPWEDAVHTIEAAKSVGLAVCCGGLFGLGESVEQRVELLSQIRDLDVDSVPLNFFYPVEGTRVNIDTPLSALECLKIVAVARLMLPTKEIRVCGGREFNLGDLQSWTLICGADGLMVGGYLTTRGRAVENDLKMISDAGFDVQWHHGD